jgi:hypothetical protein
VSALGLNERLLGDGVDLFNIHYVSALRPDRRLLKNNVHLVSDLGLDNRLRFIM